MVETEQHIHFTFHVYFDVIASQAQATPSAMATYKYSFHMYLPRAAFLFIFLSKGCRVFLPDYLTGCYGVVNLDINYPSYLQLREPSSQFAVACVDRKSVV